MAEMTAAEALGILGGSEKPPQSEQELITSIIAGMTRGEKCFVLLWDSERAQIAALIHQQQQIIEALKCCGNCINWINRPEKMSCKVHEMDVAQWCRCGEWQVKEGQCGVTEPCRAYIAGRNTRTEHRPAAHRY